jgi:hypothetical protein
MEQISNETDLEFEHFLYLDRFSNFKFWNKETENAKTQKKLKKIKTKKVTRWMLLGWPDSEV